MFNLNNIRIENSNSKSILKADFSSNYFGKDEIWFSIDNTYNNAFLPDNYNCFLVALIFPAMLLQEDIYVDGCVSKKLLFNLNNYIRGFIKIHSPDTKMIKIQAKETTDQVYPTPNHTGTGFSGGIDSLCTIYEHYEKEEFPDYKIDTLLFLNTGSHGLFSNPSTEIKFHSRYEYLSKFSPLPFIALDSNIHKFHEFIPHSHEKTVTFTNAAGILSLEHFFSKYYIASSLSYGEAIKFGQKRLNKCTEGFDSTLLPLLSTETLTFIPDGEQHTRSEKTEVISSYELTKRSLNVCVNHKIEDEKNCSYCSKCLRTLFTLDSMDKLEEYSSLFDIKVYNKHKLKYKSIQILKYNKDPFAKDNVDFAKTHNKKLPSRFTAVIILIPYALKKIVKKLLKRK